MHLLIGTHLLMGTDLLERQGMCRRQASWGIYETSTVATLQKCAGRPMSSCIAGRGIGGRSSWMSWGKGLSAYEENNGTEHLGYDGRRQLPYSGAARPFPLPPFAQSRQTLHQNPRAPLHTRGKASVAPDTCRDNCQIPSIQCLSREAGSLQMTPIKPACILQPLCPPSPPVTP